MVYQRKWERTTDFLVKFASFSEEQKTKQNKLVAKLFVLRCSGQCVTSHRNIGIIKSDCKKATVYPKGMDF